jgi:hypothetical protein
MAKILYSATDPNGQTVEGFVDAVSVAQARDLLAARSLCDIRVHQEVAMAEDPAKFDGLSDHDVQRLAAFKLRVMRKPGLMTVLREVASRLQLALVADLALITAAVVMQRWGWASLLLVLALLPFGLAAWRYRRVQHYQQLLEAFAVGHWSRVEHLAQKVRSGAAVPQMLDFDLDVRVATGQVRRGQPLEDALASLSGWADKLGAHHPGLLDCRLASVHAAAEDRRGFVQRMRAACEASGQEPARVMDLALAEARFGDDLRARQLLHGLDASLLPEHASGFVHWAHGVLALRAADDVALKHLNAAVADFLALADQHASVWTALAFCACDQAMALRLAGRTPEARKTLSKVWPVLLAHADKPLIHVLKQEILAPAAATSQD